MAETASSNTRLSPLSWLWPAASVAGLLVVAAALVAVAAGQYDQDSPDAFATRLASALLNAAVVVVGGAVIAALLALAAEVRGYRERVSARRLELFRRMRAAHVQISMTQLLIRDDPGVYAEQMHALMEAAKNLEEIREEVRVSRGLYRPVDRARIMEGIARIVVFLEKGLAEYSSWCARGDPRGDPRANEWTSELVRVRESAGSKRAVSHEDWEPLDHMPPEYDAGLYRSKYVMRGYVYGSSGLRSTTLEK